MTPYPYSSYNPYQYAYQPMAGLSSPVQNQAMSQQLPQMRSTQCSGLIYVLGEEEAKAYYVAPGNTVPLFDKDKPIMYIKSVDLNGMPNMMKCTLTFENTAPVSDYVSRAEFSELSQAVNDIRNALNVNKNAAPIIEEVKSNG